MPEIWVRMCDFYSEETFRVCMVRKPQIPLQPAIFILSMSRYDLFIEQMINVTLSK